MCFFLNIAFGERGLRPGSPPPLGCANGQMDGGGYAEKTEHVYQATRTSHPRRR